MLFESWSCIVDWLGFIPLQREPPTHGTLWSTVAREQSGLRTARLAFRLVPQSVNDFSQKGNIERAHSPSNACGLVTSCTRCLHVNDALSNQCSSCLDSKHTDRCK